MLFNYVLDLVKKRPVSTFAAASLSSSTLYAYHLENETKRKCKNNELESVKLPQHYDKELIKMYWTNRPISVMSRLIRISSEASPFIYTYVFEKEKMMDNCIALREALVRLGPAFVKLGQQLSIRPDMLPPMALKELGKLCDQVDPVDDDICYKIIREDLGNDYDKDIVEMKLAAGASLGQVYKVKLKNGKSLAMKVQRPDMLEKVSLDIFLLNYYGELVDLLTNLFTEQKAFHVDFIDCFCEGSYHELDYEKEASNQLYFKKEFAKRKSRVYIPDVDMKRTSRRVITTDWVDGVKLADAPKEQIRNLIPIGVELFLTQLLDIGAFHADPHPGNLHVTNDGTLCLLDFGLCATIDLEARKCMSKAIYHLLTGNFDTLIKKDAKDLGFLPNDMDVTELKPILIKILTSSLESGSDFNKRKKKLMNISNELNEVFFRYPFSVPSYFALITRGLCLLEGIALKGDPEFDIFQASYPYVSRKAAQIIGRSRFLNLGI